MLNKATRHLKKWGIGAGRWSGCLLSGHVRSRIMVTRPGLDFETHGYGESRVGVFFLHPAQREK